MSPEKSRGVRNNNPGNIRRVRGQKWLGQSTHQPDPEFVKFDSPVYGIRALAVVLLTYYRKHNLHTVEQIITRWAPPTENETESYVHAVASRLNVAPNEPLDLYDRDVLRALVEAIIWFETGGYEYPPEIVEHAITLAQPLRLRDAAQTDTGRGSAVAAAATAAGSVATITSGLAELDWRVGVAVVIALAVAAVIAVWAWRSRRD